MFIGGIHMNFCSNCGCQLREKAQFCQKCGKNLIESNERTVNTSTVTTEKEKRINISISFNKKTIKWISGIIILLLSFFIISPHFFSDEAQAIKTAKNAIQEHCAYNGYKIDKWNAVEAKLVKREDIELEEEGKYAVNGYLRVVGKNSDDEYETFVYNFYTPVYFFDGEWYGSVNRMTPIYEGEEGYEF